MRQIIIRGGVISVEDVAPPMIEKGTVLVRVQRSSVSSGTELSGIRSSGTPLWKRAVREPEKVKRVIDVAATQGVSAVRDLISSAQTSGSVTGYSAAGVVVEVGAEVTDYSVGDRVACAGAQAAHHAELIRVPENLVVPVPDGLGWEAASTVTLGAIALQGVRRLEPTLGESVVVVGLGVLGQLTAQLLRANGCHVVGIDLDPERVRLALGLGVDVALAGGDAADIESVERLTGGVGADGVVVTASTPSSDLLSRAFRMTRRKGRVVLVGDVGLDIDRADIYEKELDFLVSTSYGPGRYDRRYEDDGLDYPIGYVRWTENRNMREYLRLIAQGSVRVDPLIGGVFPLEEAAAAYEAIGTGAAAVLVQLEYPGDATPDARLIVHDTTRRAQAGAVGAAVVGAGAFALGVHLPNLRALGEQVSLEAVVSRSGPAAAEAAARFGARYSSTDIESVLDDDSVELLLITTRHDTHAQLALRALRAGKHVLLEKPLALKSSELVAIESFFEERLGEEVPILQTGFNRRFSPYARRLAKLMSGRTEPMLLGYRMNAGRVPTDHWIQTAEGGGRNLGEACHIYDLFTFLTDARAVDVSATSIRPSSDYYGRSDNFVATIRFAEGSVATLTYTAMGSASVAKEQMDAYLEGRVLELDDYQRLDVHGADERGIRTRSSDKGHVAELEALVKAIRTNGVWPIPLWQQVQATRIALDVQTSISGGGDEPAG